MLLKKNKVIYNIFILLLFDNADMATSNQPLDIFFNKDGSNVRYYNFIKYLFNKADVTLLTNPSINPCQIKKRSNG